eukprot:5626370-Amphidinium_carterae.1
MIESYVCKDVCAIDNDRFAQDGLRESTAEWHIVVTHFPGPSITGNPTIQVSATTCAWTRGTEELCKHLFPSFEIYMLLFAMDLMMPGGQQGKNRHKSNGLWPKHGTEFSNLGNWYIRKVHAVEIDHSEILSPAN